MTLQEVCKKLNLSEATIQHSFVRTQKNLAKKGIIIERYGTGKTAKYTLKYEKCQNDTK